MELFDPQIAGENCISFQLFTEADCLSSELPGPLFFLVSSLAVYHVVLLLWVTGALKDRPGTREMTFKS